MSYTFDETLSWSQRDRQRGEQENIRDSRSSVESTTSHKSSKAKYSVYSIAAGAAIFGLPLALLAIWMTTGKSSEGLPDLDRIESADTPTNNDSP